MGPPSAPPGGTETQVPFAQSTHGVAKEIEGNKRSANKKDRIVFMASNHKMTTYGRQIFCVYVSAVSFFSR